MIDILIVEHSDHKLSSIKKLLFDDLMLATEDVTYVSDIKEAKKLLRKKFYDLLILDLVLPLEKDDIPTPEKGIGFLKDINTNPNLNPNQTSQKPLLLSLLNQAHRHKSARQPKLLSTTSAKYSPNPKKWAKSDER